MAVDKAADAAAAKETGVVSAESGPVTTYAMAVCTGENMDTNACVQCIMRMWDLVRSTCDGNPRGFRDENDECKLRWEPISFTQI